MNKFIGQQSKLHNSIVIQCACVGTCTYLNISQMYKNAYSISFATNLFDKKTLKGLDKLDGTLLDNNDLYTLYNLFKNIDISDYSNMKIAGSNKYIGLDMLKGETSKYNMYFLSFYLNEKHLSNCKPVIDITLTSDMVKSLMKALESTLGLES